MLNRIVEIFKEKDNFVLTGHVDPDWDSIGSVLALNYLLKKLGKNSLIYLPDAPPENFPRLTGFGDLNVFSSRKVKPAFTAGFVFIGLDSGDPERFGKIALLMDRADQIVNIDHHEDNKKFADVNYIDPSSASTGMIIHEIAKKMGLDDDQKFLELIAATIIGDTAAFQNSNADSRVFTMAGDFLKKGIDIYHLLQAFNSLTTSQLKLRGRAFNNLRTFCDGKIAIMFLTANDFSAAGASFKDTSNIVRFARDLKGAEVGALIWEDNEAFQVSLRSKFYVPVNKVASFFGGGGHPRAAGCRIKTQEEREINNLDDVISRLVEAIKPFFDDSFPGGV